MSNPAQVHFELSEAIKLLDWAAIYSRTAGLDQIEAGNALLFRQKLDHLAELIQAIESKLPKPREVQHADAA